MRVMFLIGLTTTAMLAAHAASAQSAAPSPSPTAPQTVPAQPIPGATTSDKLSNSGGVIRPPAQVDPGMTVKTPPPTGTMPVIPPPGTPGGTPNVVPK